MKTRNGKIARLPLEIRDQLNSRLADGEPGTRLVEWLNSNPEVIKVMAEQFDGRPITENNLSEWRAGGYEEWLTVQAFLEETRVLSENAGDLADTGISSDHLHIVLLAHHAHLLRNLEIMPQEEFQTRLNSVKKLTASIMHLRRDELARMRFQLQRERLELLREKQSLKSASSAQAAPSTSISTQSVAAENEKPGTSSLASSRPNLRSGAESSRDEIAAPPVFTLHPKPAPQIPILFGRIQPESPDPSIQSPASRDWSDSVRSTLIHPPKVAA